MLRAITLLVAASLVLFCDSVLANDVYVNGYTRRDGTYVQPYYRTAPDSSRFNNYSSQGNTNPYTGRSGYEKPSRETYTAPRAPYYGNPSRETFAAPSYQQPSYNNSGYQPPLFRPY